MGLSATALTEVDVFTANLYPPATGTPMASADITANVQALGNRTKFLNGRVPKAFSSDTYDVVGDSTVFNTTSYVGSSLTRSIIDMVAGDKVLVIASFSYKVAGGAKSGLLRLVVTDDLGGVAPEVVLTGARLKSEVFAGTRQGTLMGIHTIAADGETQVQLRGAVTVADGTAITLIEAGSIVMLVLGGSLPA